MEAIYNREPNYIYSYSKFEIIISFDCGKGNIIIFEMVSNSDCEYPLVHFF